MTHALAGAIVILEVFSYTSRHELSQISPINFHCHNRHKRMPATEDFEKLGVFYLGRPYDISRRAPGQGIVLYDSKDLLTHAVCVGMTGSGKTGLCISLIEEAAMDSIPVLAIDPKGDLGQFIAYLSGPEK